MVLTQWADLCFWGNIVQQILLGSSKFSSAKAFFYPLLVRPFQSRGIKHFGQYIFIKIQIQVKVTGEKNAREKSQSQTNTIEAQFLDNLSSPEFPSCVGSLGLTSVQITSVECNGPDDYLL